MQISKLFIDNFRNLIRSEHDFHPNLNILIGKNAQGKTNFLEALYMLGTGMSPRASVEQDIIQWDTNHYFIKGQVKTEQGTFTISIGYTKGQKRIKINETVLERRKDFLGNLLIIYFSPDDLQIIKGSPSLRRRFLDQELSLLYPLYYDEIQRYRTTLQQRNNLLKEIGQGRRKEQDLYPWDEQLSVLAGKIIKRRLDVIDQWRPLIVQYYAAIGEEEKTFQLRYVPSLSLECVSDSEHWQMGIQKSLERRRSEEIKKGITMVGPHRDDLYMGLGNEDLRYFGSQGQQRTAILALKIAEIDYIRTIKGEKPVLLLDDVLSELDEKRQKALLQLVQDDIQTFLTTTDNTFESNNISKNMYVVYKGEVKPVERGG